MSGEDKVLEAFVRLKEQNNSYELKKIGSHYYVYLSFSRWDGNLGRAKKVSLYKGKITDEGVFVGVKHRYRKNAQETAQNTNHTPPSESDSDTPQIVDVRVRQNSHKYERTLLTALSMNGRISLPMLSKMLGLSVNATDWQVKSLERRYGIKYIPEIDVGKFGYMQFLITAKFLTSMPQTDELRAALSAEPRIQLAMFTKGEFDLAIYILAKNVEEAKLALTSLRDKLSRYESTWNTIPMYEDYGFVRLRNEFICMLKEKGELLEREYAVLRELNDDGSVEFSKIDQKYGFDSGRASYSYHKLKGEGKIRRITMTMRKLPIKYVGIILKNIINKEKLNTNRPALLAHAIKETQNPSNKYTAIYDTTTPDGSISFMPVFDYNQLDGEVEEIIGFDLGMKVTTLIATNLLVGDFCYRRFDNAHSVQQRILESEYSMGKVHRANYEETGRKKTTRPKIDIRGARVTEESVIEIS